MPSNRRLYPRVRSSVPSIDDESALGHRTSFEQEVGEDPTIDLSRDYNTAIGVPKPKTSKIMTTNHASAPTNGQEPPNGTGTTPDITTDPYIPLLKPRIPTRNFIWMFELPTGALTADAGAGFTTVIWIRNRELKVWGQTKPFTGLAFATWITAGADFNGGELFFQILAATVGVNGPIRLHVMEQG